MHGAGIQTASERARTNLEKILEKIVTFAVCNAPAVTAGKI